MFKLVIWAFAAVGGLAIAAPLDNTHTVHERRSGTPARWVKGDRIHPDTVFPMRVGLAQSNLHLGESYLTDVSHPASANYGKHWTHEQVIDTFKPSDDTVEAVFDFLTTNGIAKGRITQSPNKAWLGFNGTNAEVENMLKTEYHKFKDSITGAVVPACDEYSLPADIQKHIDYITPGTHLIAANDHKISVMSKQETNPAASPDGAAKLSTPITTKASIKDASQCDQLITPACIKSIYQIPSDRTGPNANNSLGVYATLNEYWNQQDLDGYFSTFAPDIPAGTHPFTSSIDGGVAQSSDPTAAGGSETTIDLSVAYPIVYPQTITVFATDDLHYGASPDETYKYGFNTFLDAIDGSYCDYSAYGETGDSPVDPQYPDPSPDGYQGPLQCGVHESTRILSFSYGGQEVSVPASYQRRQCLEFLKLGLQGITVVFASGDNGVADAKPPVGQTTDSGCLGPNQNIFNPTWPSNCPWVLSVGATKAVADPAGAGKYREQASFEASSNYSGGGGFSNIYAAAQYQIPAMNHYYQNYPPPYDFYGGITDDVSSIGHSGASANGGVYNYLGRGYPDVSAIGDNFALYGNGSIPVTAGTSVSAPIWASILNRIIDERFARGMGPIGFINIALYNHPEVFNDITDGHNVGCGTGGFSAAPGWDPVTGLGTPNYTKLLNLFLTLP